MMKVFYFYCFDDKGKGRRSDYIIIVAKAEKEAWEILLGNSSHNESETVKKLKEEYRIEGATELNGEPGQIANFDNSSGRPILWVQQKPARNRHFNNRL